MAGYDQLDFAKDITQYAIMCTQPKYGTNFLPNKIPDMEDVARENLKNAIKDIRHIPEWFVIDAYLERWTANFQRFLNRENHTKLLNNNKNKIESLDDIVNVLESSIRVMNMEFENWHKKSLKEFLESDLPLDLYNLYTTSYIERVRAMDHMVQRLYTLRQKAYSRPKNSHNTPKILTGLYGGNYKEILWALSGTLRSELTLRMYIMLINGKNVNDLFESKPIKLKGDKALAVYVDKYKENLFGLITALAKSGINDSNLISPPLQSFEDFGIKLQQMAAKHKIT